MSRIRLNRLGIYWIAGILALVAAGCMVGPNYHPPVVSAPPQWTGLSAASTDDTSIATPEAAAVADWWKNFNDPELDSLITKAVQSNLTLKQAQTRILQAREARTVAGAGLFPSATASSNVSNSSSALTVTPTGGSALSSASKTRNLFQDGLDATWELDFFGGVRRGVEAADSNLQAAVEDSRDTMVTLTSEVALNYIELRGFQQQIAIAEKNLDAQRQTADITHKRFDVGFASRLDTANADAQVATTQAQIPLLEASAQQTIYSLSVLLGLEPGALLSELTPKGEIPPTPPVVPVGLPSDLLQRRPDIRRAEAQLHSATAEIGVATAQLFPQFSLTGSAGQQGLTVGSLSSLASRFWSVGPGVTLPIFNAGKIRANIRLQNAVQQQALLTYQQTVLTAFQDVETALVAYEKEQQHHAALLNAVSANRTAVDLSTRLYTAGQGDFLNVLTAERDLYSSEDALVQSDRTIDTNLIAIYKALGGGWEKGTPAVAPPTVPPGPVARH